MKLILTILSSLFWVSYSMAQFPNTHTQSNGHTKEVFPGAVNPQKGLINGRYSDTAAANLDYVKGEPGIQIITGDDIWLRNSTATKWLLVATNIIPIQNGLISPGVVSWADTGLTFDITSATYAKNGVIYTVPSGQVTLSPSDPDNPRIDLIVLDTVANVFSVVTGVAGAVPITPQADPFSQIALTTGILLNAGDTIPTSVISKIIYDENDSPPEWAVTTNGTMTYDKDDETMPYSGIKDILVSSITSYPLIIFTGSSQSVKPEKILKFRIKLTDTLPEGTSISVFLYNGAKSVAFSGWLYNSYGFRSDNVMNYQNVSIPFSSLPSFSDSVFNRVYIQLRTLSTYTNDFYIDRVELQDGITNISPQIDYSNKVDSMSKSGDNIYYWVKGVPVLVGSVGGGNDSTKLAIADTAAMLMPYIRTVDADAAYYPLTTNPSNYLQNVSGLIIEGDNVTITGDGTTDNPFVVNSTGGSGDSTVIKVQQPIYYDALDSTLKFNRDSLYNVLKYTAAARDSSNYDDSTLIPKDYLNQRIAAFLTSVAWGDIAGTLSDQTDLQNALDAKQATLISGTNIKTINSTSLLGSGDISISGGAGGISQVIGVNGINNVNDSTVEADTALLSTKYFSQHIIDSLAAVTVDSNSIHIGYITIAGDTAIVFSDLKGNSDTVAVRLLFELWKQNGNDVYYDQGNVGIPVDTPAYQLHIQKTSVTKGDNSGLYLQSTDASSGAKISPPLIIGAVNNNSGTLSYRDFIIETETPGSASLSNLKIYPRTNYGTYTTPIFTLGDNGSLTLPGIITQTAGGTNSFSAAISSAGNIISTNGSANSQTRYGFRNTGSANTISGTFYGFSQESTLLVGYGATLIPFRNLYGTNLFNQSGGSTGIGVDSVNSSAKLELKDSTKGFLLTRMTKAQRDKIISSITGSITNAGSGYTTTTGSPIALTGGSGSGAYGIFVVSGGVVTSMTITVVGAGYQVGDVLSFSGTGTGFQYTLSAVGAPAEGLQIYQTDNDPGPRYYIGGTWYKTTLTAD